MKPSYFSTDVRLVRLVYAADKWIETPWCPNSETRGERGGVSCHNLPCALYVEAGALPVDFPRIRATPTQSNNESMMEPFLDGRPEFERIERNGESILPLLQPGDLLGIWLARDDYGNRVLKRHVNHLGVLLNFNTFVHVLAHKKTDIDLINVPPWSQRLIAAWRPIGPVTPIPNGNR